MRFDQQNRWRRLGFRQAASSVSITIRRFRRRGPPGLIEREQAGAREHARASARAAAFAAEFGRELVRIGRPGPTHAAQRPRDFSLVRAPPAAIARLRRTEGIEMRVCLKNRRNALRPLLPRLRAFPAGE
jgi:hypothetical protein